MNPYIIGGVGVAGLVGALYYSNAKAAAAASAAAQSQAATDAANSTASSLLSSNGTSLDNSSILGQSSDTLPVSGNIATLGAASGGSPVVGTDTGAALLAALTAASSGSNSTTTQALQLQSQQETDFAAAQTQAQSANLASQVLAQAGNTIDSGHGFYSLVTPTSGGGFSIASGNEQTNGLLGIVAPTSGVGANQNNSYALTTAQNIASQNTTTLNALAANTVNANTSAQASAVLAKKATK